ncbi:EamA family transporter [Myroides phaeus]|uniref:Inner membrane transporter RhtA n=1 Tax=Myroides phaeus TaxID=702745 RepID=A0A1G8DJQ0_9FLAO|nr:DMT family transporter [Myroides phaeus]SDH57885.1 inner membrane transporter RhtA [Myroides phaeus]
MKKSIPAIPAVILSMMSVQGGASIAKSLFPVLGAAGTSSLRIGISAIILFFYNRPNLKKLTTFEWKISFMYGMCLAFMNLLFYFSIQRIPIGLGVTIEFIGPLALAIFSSRKKIDYLWAIIAAIGILLIVPWQNNSLDFIGLLLAFAAGLFWAGYIVVGGKVAQKMDSNTSVTVGMGFASLFIIPFALVSGDLMALTGKLLLIGTAVALLSSAIPFSLDIIALKKLPSKTFSILMSLQPAFGAISGLLFLGEILTFYQWLSILCVISASIGTTISSRKDV